MQANESALGKCPDSHCFATFVVGITDDEAREHEEEIYSQITMIDYLVEKTCGESFADMITNDNESSYAAQSVQ